VAALLDRGNEKKERLPFPSKIKLNPDAAQQQSCTPSMKFSGFEPLLATEAVVAERSKSVLDESK
jgi:hypothetical protein